MPEHETLFEPRTPWYRKILMVILLPFVLPIVPLFLAIMLALGLCALICNFVLERRFRAQIRRCGRFLHWRQLSGCIAEEGAGTLIIESPSLGWGITHAWWTPERVLTVSPYAVPTRDEWRSAATKMQCLNWDRWHWENYTNPDNGRGLLLRVWNGRSLENWARQTFPSVDVVHTWTALVHAPNPAAQAGGA